MLPHTPLSLLWVAEATTPALSSLAAYLESIPYVQVNRVSQWPAITITQRRAEGEIVRISPPVAERAPYAFRRNLADHLLLGEPIGAPLADSVKVVSILETAAPSMSRGGTREVIDGN